MRAGGGTTAVEFPIPEREYHHIGQPDSAAGTQGYGGAAAYPPVEQTGPQSVDRGTVGCWPYG
jgi:hypothetical protein